MAEAEKATVTSSAVLAGEPHSYQTGGAVEGTRSTLSPHSGDEERELQQLTLNVGHLAEVKEKSGAMQAIIQSGLQEAEKVRALRALNKKKAKVAESSGRVPVGLDYDALGIKIEEDDDGDGQADFHSTVLHMRSKLLDTLRTMQEQLELKRKAVAAERFRHQTTTSNIISSAYVEAPAKRYDNLKPTTVDETERTLLDSLAEGKAMLHKYEERDAELLKADLNAAHSVLDDEQRQQQRFFEAERKAMEELVLKERQSLEDRLATEKANLEERLREKIARKVAPQTGGGIAYQRAEALDSVPVPDASGQLVPSLAQGSRPQSANSPSDEEIREYALYLGMDPDRDQELLYIAKWALTAPLSEGWTEHTDDEGNEFFYNKATGVSTYEHPLDDMYRAYYRQLKNKEGTNPRMEATKSALMSL